MKQCRATFQCLRRRHVKRSNCHAQIIFTAIRRCRQIPFLSAKLEIVLASSSSSSSLFSLTCHIVVYQSIFVSNLIGCDTPFSCRQQRHCRLVLHPLPSKCQFISSSFCQALASQCQLKRCSSSKICRRVAEEMFQADLSLNRAFSSFSLLSSPRVFFFLSLSLAPSYPVQSRTCERVLSGYISLSTIPANTRLFACSRTRTHTHLIAYQHRSRRRKSFFLAAPLTRGRGERETETRGKNSERRSNSRADWSRVTVHIKSNYKCSLAASLVFSLSVSNRLRCVFFSSSSPRRVAFSPSSLAPRKRRKCEKVRRLRVTDKD